jgi:hypothetical protein
MKTNLNKLTNTGVASLLMVIVSTSPAMAIPDTTNRNNELPSIACNRITTLKNNSEKTIDTQLSNLETVFANQLSKITEKEATNDQKITTTRTAAKNQFEEKIQTILAQTGLTESQIQAINDYKNNIQTANVTRQSAVDAARSEYRTALSNTVSAQQQILTQSVKNYKTAVSTAFNNANTNCSQAGSSAELRLSVKTARESLTAARETSKSAAAIKQLSETRNTAIKQADKIFTELATEYAKTLTENMKTQQQN